MCMYLVCICKNEDPNRKEKCQYLRFMCLYFVCISVLSCQYVYVLPVCVRIDSRTGFGVQNTYTYIHIHTHIYMQKHIWISMCMYVHVFRPYTYNTYTIQWNKTSGKKSVYIWYVCVCMCMYVYVCVCILFMLFVSACMVWRYVRVGLSFFSSVIFFYCRIRLKGGISFEIHNAAHLRVEKYSFHFIFHLRAA